MNYNLTEEQQCIVAAPPDAKQLITAGPGTGKTHTLIARLDALIENYELAGASEVLVLSFSRAAVRAVRERIGMAEAGSEVRFVRANTFDSFATQLLSRIAPDGPWTSLNFDKRIEAATYLIRNHPEARETIHAFGHILIDELQDLVGVRDDMVRAVLETASAGPGGWTLLGDPAQGIYNFSLDGEARKVGSAALYKWLRQRFGDAMQERILTVNHRAQSRDAKKLAATLAPFGKALCAARPNYEKIRLDLDDVLLELDDLGELQSTPTQAAFKAPIKTALLCRNNGQALMLSRHFYEQGIKHHYQRGATDRSLPAWIGTIFHDFEGKTIGKSTFAELCTARLGDDDFNQHFRSLRRTAGKGKDDLDLDKLARRVREGNLPDELCEQPSGALTVSTVHRAKGLEFDRVVLVWSKEDLAEDGEPYPGEEARVSYVALTRPRRLLYRLAMLPYTGWMDSQNPAERWTRKYHHAKLKFRIGEVEIVGDDVHRLDPAGGFLLDLARTKETQNYIRDAVKPDDPVALERVETKNLDGLMRYHYVIFHEGRAVGVTCEQFGAELYSVLRHKRSYNWKVEWPTRIEKLRVQTVDTVAGRPECGIRCGLGNTGLWLRVRVAGLGALRFGTSGE